MRVHTEIHLENEICRHLATNGRLHRRAGDAAVTGKIDVRGLTEAEAEAA